MDQDLQEIPESSSFFQGHIDQFFSKGKTSFQIISNFQDMGETDKFNVEKYKPIFIRRINEKIGIRNQGGGCLSHLRSDNLEIKYIKLVDDVKTEDVSGKFKIYPRGALCTKGNCNQYFDLNKGRKCGHSSNDPWEQVTFLAFCDSCGRLLPLHYMSNIEHDCKKCGEKNSLLKLEWGRKDDPGSYKVRCKKCGYVEGLYFFNCNHDKGALSTLPKKKFRAVPARAGAILHPVVESIPDIPQEDERDPSGRRNTLGKLLSEAFNSFFTTDVKESMLYLPEFLDDLRRDSDFWTLEGVEFIAKQQGLELDNITDVEDNNLLLLIRTLIRNAKTSLTPDCSNLNKLRIMNGLEKIEASLNKFKDLPFEEEDLQGLFLSRASSTETLVTRKKPKTPPLDLERWLKKYGLKEVKHISEVNIIQCLLGIIEGSTRKNNPLFRYIKPWNQKKTTVYVRDFKTEGVLFQLNERKVLEWLDMNKGSIDPSIKINFNSLTNPKTHLRRLLQKNDECREAVEKLLHTYSHLLIQESTLDTGLDISSLSEIIYPSTASFFIYSTNTINIGGLEFTFDYHLDEWFNRLFELASDCPQDPACIIDEGGSCNACCYVPEFVCNNFNENLDRSTLIGASPRFSVGYLM